MAEQNVEIGDGVSWRWGGAAPGGEVSKVVEEGQARVVSHRGNEIRKSAEPGDPAVEISRSGDDVVKNASELEVVEKAGSALNGDGEKEDEKEEEEEEEETNGEAKTGEKRDRKESEKNGDSKAAENRAKEEEKSEDQEAEDQEAEDQEAEDQEAEDQEAEDQEIKDQEVEDQEAEEESDEKEVEKKDDEPAQKKQKTEKSEPAEKKGRGRPKKITSESNGTNHASKKGAPAKTKAPKKAATESGEPRRSGRNKAD